jgi:hypothetical protein
MANDRFDKFNLKGAPKKNSSEKRTKKVMLSMTESRYEQLRKYQDLLNKNTLTSTIDYFIDKGIDKTREDFEQVQDR